MSALPRKTGGSNVGPRVGGAALSKQAGPLPSSQYLDALNVLCEATMGEAIALALSEKDYQSQSSGEKSDLKKLLEIEKKCKDAAKVIHKEALPAPTVAMPPSMPTIPAARVNPAATKKAAVVVSKTLGAAPKGMVGKNITPLTSSKTGLVPPIRRGSLAGARPVSLQQKRAMVQQLQRSESDETLGSAASAHKKPRIGAGSSIGFQSDAPPPDALNFLKKLNQDKAAATSSSATAAADTPKPSISAKAESKPRKKEKEIEKEKPPVEDDDDDSVASVEDKDAKEGSPSSRPPPREGVRKNPARGAKR